MGQQAGDSSHVCLSAELAGLIYSAAGMRNLESCAENLPLFSTLRVPGSSLPIITTKVTVV